MHKFTLRTSLFLLFVGLSAVSIAQSNTISNTTFYRQNFDNMAISATAALPDGWAAEAVTPSKTVGPFGGASTTTQYIAAASMSATAVGGVYNFGAGTTTNGNGDRAVGGILTPNNPKTVNVLLDLVNSGTTPIATLNVSYSIEKYRNGSNPDGADVQLYFSTNGNNWTVVPSGLTHYNGDGNNSGFSPAPDASQTRYVNNVNVGPLAIAAGAHVYLSWDISVPNTTAANANNSMALGIDDVVIGTTSGAPVIQTPYYFRSVANGAWNAAATWESSDDNINWYPATDVLHGAQRGPNSNDYTITVQSANTVTVSGAETADQLIVNGVISISGSLSIYDGTGFDLTVNTGGSVTSSGSGKLVLKSYNGGSSDVGTASVGPVAGSINAETMVERYISAKYNRSAWRLLAAPLKNGAYNTSINSNWQTLFSPNGTPSGTGMRVSGPTTAGSGGFDDATPQYSMKSWDVAAQAFTPVTNTLTTSLFNPNGYFTFIRGDRFTPIGSASNTVIAAEGLLKTGSVDIPTSATNNAFTMVGNPYASAIDLLTFSLDNSSSSNIKSNYYYWDPYLSGSYGVGGFVTVSIDNNTKSVMITPQASSDGSALTPGDETRFLQSGQAMFVQSTSTGINNVTFNEAQKSYNTANNIYRTSSIEPENLRVNLIVNANGSSILADGIVAVFHPSYSAAVDNYDAVKLNNSGESISFMRTGTSLSVERRPTLSENEILTLNLINLQANVSYQLEIKPSINSNGLTAFLIDNYLKTSTPVDLSKVTTVNFTINTDAASTGANRFYISFAKPAVVTTVGRDGISVFPNPVTNGTINLQMNNMPAGIYNVRVINGVGQIIVNRQINHSSGNSTETIQLGKGAVKGIYQLEVVKPDNTKFASKVIAN